MLSPALLARSLYNLKTLDAGFNGDRVLVFTLDSYGTTLDPAARSAVYADLLSRLRTLPGVTRRRGVAISAGAYQRERPIARPARLARKPSMDRSAFTNMMTPGYFDTFGIRTAARP